MDKSWAIARARGEPFPERIRKRMATFPGRLEETFTSGLALKLAPGLPIPVREKLARFVRTRRLPDRVRFHYFETPEIIAADTDTSGVCLVGLWRARAISPDELCAGAMEILQSAATEDLQPALNISHGGPNGELRAGVLKPYWDDHDEGATSRRGRKHGPVMVANALHAVLLAVQHARLLLDQPVQLCEFDPAGRPMHRVLTAAEIVDRSLSYLQQHLLGDSRRQDTAYYLAPGLCLHSVAELVHDGGPLARPLAEGLAAALAEWADNRVRRRAAPQTREVLDLAAGSGAFQALRRAVPAVLRDRLVQAQRADGSWPAAACYRLRTAPLFFGSPELTTLYAIHALR